MLYKCFVFAGRTFRYITTKLVKIKCFFNIYFRNTVSKMTQLLETQRLLLRPLSDADAEYMCKYANDEDIARNTLRIPHPYTIEDAKKFITACKINHPEGDCHELVYGVEAKEEGHLIGSVGLVLSRSDDKGELGYWIGKPFWGKGYATEATQRLLTHGFSQLNLNCIAAKCFSRNPASSSVIRKLGMHHEGQLRQRYKKWGEYVDIESYSILREEFEDKPSELAAK